MHQYTADLANRAAAGKFQAEAKAPRAAVITTATLPRDRYSPLLQLITPVTTHGTGFSGESLDIAAYRRLRSTLDSLPPGTPCHFTGVHAWNLPLVYALRRRGLPVIHTLHDLDPHQGVRFGGLIRLWNRLILASGAHILVHGRCYRERLLALGLPPTRVTAVPLLHGFWGYDAEGQLGAEADPEPDPVQLRHIIFFGRLELYKGIDTLLAAWTLLNASQAAAAPQAWAQRLILAGAVGQGVALPPLPPGVELRDRRIPDAEAIELFRQAALLVLPYRDATQSALIAAAYRFGVPVIVTRRGALPEYVVEGETGWIVPPDNPGALAAALREALADPERLHRMGAAGRSWFSQQREREEKALTTLYLAAKNAGPTPVDHE